MTLLDAAVAGHGGLERWRAVSSLTLQVRIGGLILASRLASPRTRSFEVVIDTRRVQALLRPFPGPGQVGIFDAEGVRIESESGGIVSERVVVRDASGQVRRRLIWDDLDVLYFFGYALWNYSVTPYIFLEPGFASEEITPWRERDGAVWRRLRVTYPVSIPTHSREQTFYFDERGWLRRLDYTADVFSSLARGAHYCHGHREFEGLIFPTHRVVWPRRRSGRPLKVFTVMEGWVDEVSCNHARPLPHDPGNRGGRDGAVGILP